MKVSRETSLENFGFWSGAKDRAKYLTSQELETVEFELEQLYPNGIDETNLNDIFWFDFDWICELLGTTEEEVFKRDIN